jgi:PadR family transcriptional regulator, regulatory protein AphA
MSIKHTILGFLSQAPLSGYDLKKLFAASDMLYWSGNNNQIYTSLVQLHQEGLVTKEVHYQEDNPPRKVYSITEEGIAALRAWLASPPELPQLRHPFLIQLLWADQLEPAELDTLLAQYEEELRVKVLMTREQERRRTAESAESARQALLWQMIGENWLTHYQHELNWTQDLRQRLLEMEAGRM